VSFDSFCSPKTASLRESTALQAAFCSHLPAFFESTSCRTTASYWSAAADLRLRV
jgi:hypothetical protein